MKRDYAQFNEWGLFRHVWQPQKESMNVWCTSICNVKPGRQNRKHFSVKDFVKDDSPGNNWALRCLAVRKWNASVFVLLSSFKLIFFPSFSGCIKVCPAQVACIIDPLYDCYSWTNHAEKITFNINLKSFWKNFRLAQIPSSNITY